jgi:hypothetical protein
LIQCRFIPDPLLPQRLCPARWHRGPLLALESAFRYKSTGGVEYPQKILSTSSIQAL